MMGMASGMDTDFLIQQTLKLHQMKIDSRMRARTVLEWRQATQTSVRDQIQSFRNNFLTTLGSTGMLNRGLYTATSASVTGKNSGAVSVRVATSASAGTIRIDQIVSLAKGANMTSVNRASSTGQGFSTSARLDSLNFAGGRSITWGSTHYATAGDVKVDRNVVTGATNWSAATSTAKVRIDGEDRELKLTMRNDGSYDFTLGSEDEEITGVLSFDAEGKAVIESVSTGGEELGDSLAEMLTEDDGVVKLNGNSLGFTRTAEIATIDGGTATVEQRGNSVSITSAPDNGDYRIDGIRLDFYREAKIKVADEEITLRTNMTISSMLNEVNGILSDKGIKMKYDNLTDRFSFESDAIGGASFTAS